MLPGHLPPCQALFWALNVKHQGKPTASLPPADLVCLFLSSSVWNTSSGPLSSWRCHGPNCLAACEGTCQDITSCGWTGEAEGEAQSSSVVTWQLYPDSGSAELSLLSWWVLQLKQVFCLILLFFIPLITTLYKTHHDLGRFLLFQEPGPFTHSDSRIFILAN